VKSDLNETGTNPALRDVLNHEGVVEILENLKAEGLDSLEVILPEGASPETQITEILLVARDVTINRELDMPGASQEASSVNHETDYQNTDDDYGIV